MVFCLILILFLFFFLQCIATVAFGIVLISFSIFLHLVVNTIILLIYQMNLEEAISSVVIYTPLRFRVFPK